MNALSMPPLTPASLGVLNEAGRLPPAMPRYTLVALVSLDTLTIAELMTCVVVT